MSQTQQALVFLLAIAGATASCDADMAMEPHEPRDLTVTIDALPDHWPNTADFAADGQIEIAILSSADFDATTTSGKSLAVSDLDGTASVAFAEGLREEDVDGDGTDDVIGSVAVSELLASGVLASGDKARIVVSGESRLGDRLRGADVVLDASRPTMALPPPTGPHPVGVLELEWTDSSRENEVGPMAMEARKLKAQVLYPADIAPRAQPAVAWQSRDEARAMAEVVFPTLLGFELPSDFFDYISGHTVPAAAVAPGDPFPVLIFSHGAGGAPPAQAAIVTDIASHGFVVVSLYHTYFSGPVAFAGEEVITDFVSDADPEDMLRIVAADLQFALDQIEDLAASETGVWGAIDLQRVGVFGFSLGGAASAQACVDDSRFTAGLNIDGPSVGAALEVGLDQPFLLVTSDMPPEPDAAFDPRSQFLGKARNAAYSLSIPAAQHLNFTDLALEEPLMQMVNAEVAIPNLGNIDRLRVYEILNAYVVAFFSRFVADRPSSLLDEPSPYPEALFDTWSE